MMAMKPVVDTYTNLLKGVKATSDIAHLTPPRKKTDLSINLFTYRLSVWLSLVIGGIMLLEEYASRYTHGNQARDISCQHTMIIC